MSDEKMKPHIIAEMLRLAIKQNYHELGQACDQAEAGDEEAYKFVSEEYENEAHRQVASRGD